MVFDLCCCLFLAPGHRVCVLGKRVMEHLSSYKWACQHLALPFDLSPSGYLFFMLLYYLLFLWVTHLPKLLETLEKREVIMLVEVTPATWKSSELRCQRSTGFGATMLFFNTLDLNLHLFVEFLPWAIY